jgi:hypothetical protein
MATALGARPMNIPIPTGAAMKVPVAEVGNVIYPATDNWLLPGTGGGARTGVYRRTERFWLRAGASTIALPTAGGAWTAYVYAMRLVVNGSYGNDLNGYGIHTKYNSVDGPAGGNNYWGTSISCLFYCEANTDYEVYLLSRYGGGNVYYYQANSHYNMWAYTIGEGAY